MSMGQSLDNFDRQVFFGEKGRSKLINRVAVTSKHIMHRWGPCAGRGTVCGVSVHSDVKL